MSVQSKNVLLLFSLVLIPVAQADIVGGELVPDRDPIQSSTAALYQPSPDGRGGALCTASLIGKDTALTAAHCIERGGEKPILMFGKDVHSASTIRRPVTAAKVNPSWAKKQGRGMDQGDIAVVKFAGGIPEGYQTVKMDAREDEIRKGEQVALAGYGISDARTKSGAGVLRKTKVQVSNPRKGKTEMVLDQSHGHGACHGDSGGPAYVTRGGKAVLAGVTNRSYPNRAPDDCAHRVVYTKVSAYRPWIDQTQKDLHRRKESEGLRLQKKVLARNTRIRNRIAKNDSPSEKPALMSHRVSRARRASRSRPSRPHSRRQH